MDRFKQGVQFGLGFSITVGMCFYLWMLLFSVNVMPSGSGVLGLGDLPPTERIDASSVILRTEHIDERSYIVEFVKRDRFTRFDYDVGDEYYPFSLPRNISELSTDGNIVYLAGSPAEAQLSRSYSMYELRSYNDQVLDMILADER